MLHSLLDIIAKPNGNYYFSGSANGIGEALVYALIGFAVVFMGIVLIIFIIWLIGLILRKTNNLAFLNKLNLKNKFKKRRKEEEKPEEPAKVNDEIPDEVKAAIIAAIMAYYDNEKPECEFVVKRIKRIEV